MDPVAAVPCGTGRSFRQLPRTATGPTRDHALQKPPFRGASPELAAGSAPVRKAFETPAFRLTASAQCRFQAAPPCAHRTRTPGAPNQPGQLWNRPETRVGLVSPVPPVCIGSIVLHRRHPECASPTGHRGDCIGTVSTRGIGARTQGTVSCKGRRKLRFRTLRKTLDAPVDEPTSVRRLPPSPDDVFGDLPLEFGLRTLAALFRLFDVLDLDLREVQRHRFGNPIVAAAGTAGLIG